MSERKVHLKRSGLYVSGVSPSNMIQAPFYNEDMIIYDLEDSVPASEKDSARFLVYNMLKEHRPADKYISVRVNGLYSEYIDEDLEAIVRAEPDCIRIPKVEYAREVREVSEKISRIEEKAGKKEGGISLICNIESYTGVINAMEIAKADPRVVALALSAEDLTASMRARRTKEGVEVFFARNVVLLACRAAGIDALDIVYSDINDPEGLKKDAELARTLGFDGKTCVHPRQIDIVNECFTPDEKEIKHALRVMKAIEEGEENGRGAVTLDGEMIDKPMEIRARTTLAEAEAAGIRTEGMVEQDG